MKTTIALVALALVGLAVVGAATATAAPTTVSQCQDLAGNGTACANATVDVEGDCTQSCTVTASGDAGVQ